MTICPICEEDKSRNLPIQGKLVCTDCFGSIVLEGLFMIQDTIKKAKPDLIKKIVTETLGD